MPAYYSTLPSPHAPGRWLVVHRVPGTAAHSVDHDCPSLDSAEKQAAWLEAERSAAAHWHRHDRHLAGIRP